MSEHMPTIDSILDNLVDQLSIRHKKQLDEKNIFIEQLIAELHSTYAALDALKVEIRQGNSQSTVTVNKDVPCQ